MLMSTRPGCGADRATATIGDVGAAPCDPASIHPGDAVPQHQSRPVGGSARVRVNVDQAGDDELAARIDDVARVGRDARLDGGDAAAGGRPGPHRVPGGRRRGAGPGGGVMTGRD